ncbi:MAG: hypothetical protein KTR28_01120 [Micavibrio sp.]|nr:hypothetical protein [Micavibrio sp.]
MSDINRLSPDLAASLKGPDGAVRVETLHGTAGFTDAEMAAWARAQANIQNQLANGEDTPSTPTSMNSAQTATNTPQTGSDAMLMAQLDSQRPKEGENFDYEPPTKDQTELENTLKNLINDPYVTHITADDLAHELGQDSLSPDQISYAQNKIEQSGREIEFSADSALANYGQDALNPDRLGNELDPEQLKQQQELQIAEQNRLKQQQLEEQRRLEEEALREKLIAEGKMKPEPELDTQIAQTFIPGMGNIG